MLEPTTILIAFLGGVLPCLLWLAFWLQEDKCEPEPKRLIFYAFLAGALSVLFVIPLEKLASLYTAGFLMITAWAAIEEILKFGLAYLFVLRRRELDEPIDALVYMISAALGFSAIENTLFLIGPLSESVSGALLTGNLRFIGATLLHTLASAVIGMGIAFGFQKAAAARRLLIAGALILAIALHTLFNFLILNGNGEAMFPVFLCVWVGIVLVLFCFERLKIKKRDYC